MIIFDSENKVFKLDTCESTYLIGIYEENYILNYYYGAPIPETCVGDLIDRNANASFSLANPVIGENGFTPDCAPMEYGTNGAADFRVSALSIRNANGDTTTDIRYKGHKIYKGKPSLSPLPYVYANNDDEADTLDIYAEDKVTGAEVTLRYTVFEKMGAMTRSAIITNASDKAMDIKRAFSLCVNMPEMDYDMITFYGRHAKERSREQRALAHGLQGIHSKRGASSHCHNPFVAFLKHGAGEEQGEAMGFNLVYSGNFSAVAECDFNSNTRFIMGINPEDFSWHLEAGESFTTPECVMVYTDKGLGEMSRIYHRLYNNNLVRGKYKHEKRPLLINSWEAAYFDFDTDKLVSFAERAKEAGMDMLVMDDGWFGVRNADNCSLGDWFVNEEKLPGGLDPLISRVNALGLKFGIWYEPEMISPDSDLYRAHPDWCVHVEGREPMIGRRQLVLDVSREDVRDNIFNQMYEVLSKHKIDYVKWDFNRNISDAGSAILPADKKQEFFHRFILGTYDLMDRFTKAFPDILFENCSGGGGRFDPGMLYYSPQIWASDQTDPIERLTIQFGTSICYPASTMGAHVSACDRTGYETKGDVALWGTFGYELDPNKLTDDEKALVKEQVKEYHKYYDLIHYGDLYRLIDPYFNHFRCAWSFVSPDKTEVLATAVTMRYDRDMPTFILKLRGLDKDKKYVCEETGKVYSGAFLMNAGINLTNKQSRDGESIKFYFKAQ
ncbi:MAG: alpha-galactosidase [Ruminococcaceae bacterium]|nr:alpha-galactosidase [Oscillospiraceae bacterium]